MQSKCAPRGHKNLIYAIKCYIMRTEYIDGVAFDGSRASEPPANAAREQRIVLSAASHAAQFGQRAVVDGERRGPRRRAGERRGGRGHPDLSNALRALQPRDRRNAPVTVIAA